MRGGPGMGPPPMGRPGPFMVCAALSSTHASKPATYNANSRLFNQLQGRGGPPPGEFGGQGGKHCMAETELVVVV